MPGQRQDYILRQIELLRQFIARLASGNRERELEEQLSSASRPVSVEAGQAVAKAG